MADLSDLQAAQSVKVIGSSSTGVEGVPVQSTANGALHSNLRDASGNELLGQKTAANSIPVVVANGNLNTYSVAFSGLVTPNLATDIFGISGSATKLVTIKKIALSGTRTTAGAIPVQLIKRSTPNTNGGAASLVQFQQNTDNTNNTTIAVTVTATGAGNLIVIAANNNDNRTITGVSDGTSAFTQATGARGNFGANSSDIWYLLSSNAGKTTFTVTFSGNSTTKDIFFWEVSGNGTATFDNAKHINNGTVAATDNGVEITTVGASFIASAINTGGTIIAAPAVGNAFTTGGGINARGHAAVSLSTAVPGTYTSAFSDSGSGQFANATAAFTISGSQNTTVSSTPHDSTNPAATATVKQYQALPTLGTAVGTLRSASVFIPTTTVAPTSLPEWAFNLNQDQGIVLRGTSESLNINLAGTTVAGSNFYTYIEWTEE